VPVVVHLSDIHFGAHRDDLVESLLVDISGRQPDLIVVSGDLTQRARRTQFAQAEAFLARLPAPILTVLGNHDLPLFDVPQRLAAPTRRYERFISPDLEPVVSVQDLTAVGLDTMPRWRWKSGYVSRRQAAFVEHALEHGPSQTWRLLVTHHPLLPTKMTRLGGRGHLTNACARAGVTVVLSGHTHTPSVDLVTFGARDNRRQALAVVAGTAISTRTRGATNSHAVLDFSGPMSPHAILTVEIRQPDGANWSAARTFRFQLGDAGIVAL
jgi:3',5'-cyclic AMP phosphodiesterase CpdA